MKFKKVDKNQWDSECGTYSIYKGRPDRSYLFDYELVDNVVNAIVYTAGSLKECKEMAVEIEKKIGILGNARTYAKIDSGRSALANGVLWYANNFIDSLEYLVRNFDIDICDMHDKDYMESVLMEKPTAASWLEYSKNGLALTDSREIAEKILTKTQMKKYHNGDIEPANMTWLDVQAVVLEQAFELVYKSVMSAYLVWTCKDII